MPVHSPNPSRAFSFSNMLKASTLRSRTRACVLSRSRVPGFDFDLSKRSHNGTSRRKPEFIVEKDGRISSCADEISPTMHRGTVSGERGESDKGGIDGEPVWSDIELGVTVDAVL